MRVLLVSACLVVAASATGCLDGADPFVGDWRLDRTITSKTSACPSYSYDSPVHFVISAGGTGGYTIESRSLTSDGYSIQRDGDTLSWGTEDYWMGQGTGDIVTGELFTVHATERGLEGTAHAGFPTRPDGDTLGPECEVHFAVTTHVGPD